MVGNALADALGHPLEFLDVDDSLPPYAAQRPFLDPQFVTSDGKPLYHEPANRFRLQPGQWTDDFSMAVCLADSLLVNAHYDGRDARIRWYNWWNCGYNNAFRFDPERPGRGSVGLGGNIQKSLCALEDYTGAEDTIPPYYESGGEDAGNGSIMRLSPVPIMYHSDVQAAERVAAQQSRSTHPGNDAAVSCQFMAYFIVSAIQKGLPEQGSEGCTPTQRFVDEVVKDFMAAHDMAENTGYRNLERLLLSREPPSSKEYCWNWRMPQLPIWKAIGNRSKEGTYNGYPILPGYFGSYCLDGLAMALWGVYHSTSFEDAVIRVINLLGDADSTGAIAGQLAGALYGYSGIRGKPRALLDEAGNEVETASMGELWLRHLRRWDPFSEIPLKAVLLYALQPTEALHAPEEAPANGGQGTEGAEL